MPLECRGGRWAAARPVALTTGGHVEFKFVRLRPDGVAWEEVPNRALEVPMGDADVNLKCEWNGDFTVRLAEPDKDAPAHAANEWRQRCDEITRVLAAQRRSVEKRRDEHRQAQERRAAMAAQLRAEIEEARRAATEEVAAPSDVAAAAPPPMAEVLGQGAAATSALAAARGPCSSSSTSCGGSSPEIGAGGASQPYADEREVGSFIDHALGQGFNATYQSAAPASLARPADRELGPEQPPGEPTMPSSSSSSSRPKVPSIAWGSGFFEARPPAAPAARSVGELVPQLQGVGLVEGQGTEPATISPTFERSHGYLSKKSSSKRQGAPGRGHLLSPRRPRYDRSNYGPNAAVASVPGASVTTSACSEEEYHASLACVSLSGSALGGPLMASHEVMAAFRTARDRYAELRSTADAAAAGRGMA